MKTILVRMPNWLGDCVMATAFIKPLKKKFSRIIAAVPRGLERVFEGNPGIDGVIPYDRKSMFSTLRAAKTAAAMKPDCAVSLTPSLSSHLFMLLCGAGKRYGYADDAGSFFLTGAYKRDKSHRREHVTAEYEKIFSMAAGSAVKRGAQYLNPGRSGVNPGLNLNDRVKKVFIAPFAKGGRAKTWPPEKYEEVIKALLKKNRAVYVTGLESDRAYVFSKDVSKNKKFFDMRGAPLGDVFFVLSKMDAFVGNDSGLMHAADALGVKCTVIYGATAPQWGGPLNKGHRNIYKGTECQPCYERECRYGHYKCMNEVKAGEVLKMI